MTRFNQPLGGNEMPRFGGPTTMMRLPTQHTAEGLDACFVGIPMEQLSGLDEKLWLEKIAEQKVFTSHKKTEKNKKKFKIEQTPLQKFTSNVTTK